MVVIVAVVEVLVMIVVVAVAVAVDEVEVQCCICRFHCCWHFLRHETSFGILFWATTDDAHVGNLFLISCKLRAVFMSPAPSKLWLTDCTYVHRHGSENSAADGDDDDQHGKDNKQRATVPFRTFYANSEHL